MEWERREGESSQAYAAFQEYLRTRSCSKVAQNLSKSRQLITGWSSKYEWVKRSTAYDNSLMQEARQKIQSRWASFLERQYSFNEKILNKIDKAMSVKEFDKSGLKTLNELKTQCFNEQLAILEKLGSDAPPEMKIKIEIAGEDDENQ